MDAKGITGLLVAGEELKANVAAAVTVLEVEQSTNQVSSMKFTLTDPGFKLLGSGLFSVKTTVTLEDLDMAVFSIETPDGAKSEQVLITCQSRGAQRLQQERGGLLTSMGLDSFLTAAAGRVGYKAHAQTDPNGERSIERVSRPGQRQSTWDVLVKLSDEIGYWFFEDGATFFLGKPSWLLQTTPRTFSVGWNDSAGKDRNSIQIPVCRRHLVRNSDGEEEAATVVVSLSPDQAASIRPGQVMGFSGVPGFAGRYLVTHVWRLPGTAIPCEITATAPVDPVVKQVGGDNGADTSDQLGSGVPAIDGLAVGGPFAGGTSATALLQQVERARTQWPFIDQQEKAKGLPRWLLYAVGSRETNLNPIYTQGSTGDRGHGHGVWQLDDRSHTIPDGFDLDAEAQCRKAAAMLQALIARYRGNTREALNAYNSGQGSDAGTTGGNYGLDVLARRQCIETNMRSSE